MPNASSSPSTAVLSESRSSSRISMLCAPYSTMTVGSSMPTLCEAQTSPWRLARNWSVAGRGARLLVAAARRQRGNAKGDEQYRCGSQDPGGPASMTQSRSHGRLHSPAPYVGSADAIGCTLELGRRPAQQNVSEDALRATSPPPIAVCRETPRAVYVLDDEVDAVQPQLEPAPWGTGVWMYPSLDQVRRVGESCLRCRS
jgi:hypothetical protein